MGGPSSVSAEQEMGVDPWLYLIDVNPRAEAVAWVYETSQTGGSPRAVWGSCRSSAIERSTGTLSRSADGAGSGAAV